MSAVVPIYMTNSFKKANATTINKWADFMCSDLFYGNPDKQKEYSDLPKLVRSAVWDLLTRRVQLDDRHLTV